MSLPTQEKGLRTGWLAYPVILKKEKKPNDVINIIYVFDRESNTINFPNTEMLGFINSC